MRELCVHCDHEKKHKQRILYDRIPAQFVCGEVLVQGDEGPVCGVAQGVHVHGVTVRHEEEKEEDEIEQEVDGEKEEKRSNNNAHVHGWDEGEKTSASGLEPCGM